MKKVGKVCPDEWRLRGAPIAFDMDATSAGRALQTHPTTRNEPNSTKD